jgi:hypothetical protein
MSPVEAPPARGNASHIYLHVRARVAPSTVPYGSQWLQQVLLMAAVAARGYMTLCLLVWDGSTVRGLARVRLLGNVRCRTNDSGLIFSKGQLWISRTGQCSLLRITVRSSVAAGP